MREFIIQYWIEVLFGLICGGVALLANRYKKLYLESKAQQKNEFWDDVKETIKKDHEILEEKIDSVNKLSIAREQNVLQQLEITTNGLTNIKTGVLSVQGRQFKNDCRKLLEKDHIITLNEYEQIRKDHNAYNLLGGNDNGDALFDLVEIKYENGLKNHKTEEEKLD